MCVSYGEVSPFAQKRSMERSRVLLIIEGILRVGTSKTASLLVCLFAHEPSRHDHAMKSTLQDTLSQREVELDLLIS